MFTSEQQAAIDKMIEDATTGLANKNKELLADLKKARKAGEITPEQMAEVEAERDRIQGELAAAQKAAKDATKKAETAAAALQAEASFTQSLLIDQGLTAELTKNGVTHPVHLKAAAAMLRATGIQVVADGDKRIAKAGDKSLDVYVKEWAAGDEGKNFVTAAGNTGGGAPGGSGKGGGKTMSRTAFESATPTDKAAFIKDGGKLTD